MERVKFGKTDMMVTKFALGCMPFGTPNLAAGWDPYSAEGEKVVEKTINTALDMGINYLDTAVFYGYGHSETLVGRVMKTRRSDCYLASKCSPRASYDEVIKSCEDSLRRLQCDYLDVLQLHGSTHVFNEADRQHIVHGGPLDALNELKRRGLIRYLGITAEDHLCIDPLIEAGLFDTVQVCYNIIRQGAGVTFLNKCKDGNYGVCTMRPVTSGIFQRQLEFLCPEWNENNRASMVSLAFGLSDSRVHMLNIGMRTPASIERNMKFLNEFMPKFDIAEVPVTTGAIYKSDDVRHGLLNDKAVNDRPAP